MHRYMIRADRKNTKGGLFMKTNILYAGNVHGLAQPVRQAEKRGVLRAWISLIVRFNERADQTVFPYFFEVSDTRI